MRVSRRTTAVIAVTAAVLLTAFWFASVRTTDGLREAYVARESRTVTDRFGETIAVEPNTEGDRTTYVSALSPRFTDALIASEDRFFRFHPGVNPVSIVRSLVRRVTGGSTASSTLTQQLVKILDGDSNERTLRNKLAETWGAMSLELHANKDEILRMYANSAYFGNGVQGIETASRLYFGKRAIDLDDDEILRLIATVPSPSTANPFEKENVARTTALAKRLGRTADGIAPITNAEARERRDAFDGFVRAPDALELLPLSASCPGSPRLSIDQELNEKIREITARRIEPLLTKGGTHAAIVVIDLKTNALIALVGSPHPELDADGYRIDMAVEPRPVGSTVKPFIYAKGFERGLRPYTIVDDREYRYTTALGESFYPKNYDYRYRGPVSLHYALANSLNVPTVKVLDYVGIDEFNRFLTEDLGLRPVQDIESYQLGIALGGLEMDLLTLSYYFTALAHHGMLSPLLLCDGSPVVSEKSRTDFSRTARVLDAKDVELVEKIITDRTTGVDQFGATNDLMLRSTTAAVKTGTSRDYHDSWTIGYTPDVLVGVWVGNAENGPMDGVSGASGAGAVWNEVMEMLQYTDYATGATFAFPDVRTVKTSDGVDYGLPDDDVAAALHAMDDGALIASPHRGDVFGFEPGMTIALKATDEVEWEVDGEPAGTGRTVDWSPAAPGTYELRARHVDGRAETVEVRVTDEE